jgi:polyvinyl alcohol dehydrogenase (cytochrome)
MLTVLALLLTAQPPQPEPNGRALFEKQCVSCHASGDQRIPTVDELRMRTPEAIISALTNGAMQVQGAELSPAGRRAVAEYLAGRIVGLAPAPEQGRCTSAPPFDPSPAAVAWGGWGPEPDNTRFQSAQRAGLTADQVPKLKLKWAFGYPNSATARNLPNVAGNRLFVGSGTGLVYALDPKTGCTIWALQVNAGVRTPIVIAPRPGGGLAAYFGDDRSNVYAVNPADGKVYWQRRVDDHPASHVIGAPAFYQDHLYVPVSSLEEGQGGNPGYKCCTFRGSLVRMHAGTGAVLWKTHTIEAEPRAIGKNPGGSERWGPSGAAIWGAATVDPKRRMVYVATGNMYTEPQQPTSDAVMAFQLDSGKIAWTNQVTPQDVFVVGCGPRGGANCPPSANLGPDFDFGNPPMLVTIGGRDLIVIGQKSGVGWALDPDKQGAVVWQYRAGQGSALGGMEWGSAADAERVYFPVADMNGPQAGQLHAVRLDNGQRVWMTPAPKPLCGAPVRGCSPAILAAITVIPGVVFVGSNDGGVRGYSTKDGSIIWEFDTNRDFETVNGVPAKGASINGPGPVVANGMVYVNSGYGTLGGRAGNVLLAFGVE